MRTNCLFFAILLGMRRGKVRKQRRKDGLPVGRAYLSLRITDQEGGWFPHFVWHEHGHAISYKPLSYGSYYLPGCVFQGHIVWHDKPPLKQ